MAMLEPDERSHLRELLRPPSGCRLDLAVGTTFSLDLISALTLPLSFAFFDWEQSDGRPAADPHAMLEALRRYGEKLNVFCQAGQIRLPSKYPPLVTFLEPCLHEVQAPDERGVFHPKVWVLRFLSEDDEVSYRLLCLSRNLTFDRSWDTVVALDGTLTERTRAIAANHPLGDFIAWLPALTLKRMPVGRRKAIERMADELRRVRFEWPEGFEAKACRFWVGGLDGRELEPFGPMRGKSLIVSPFLSAPVVSDFVERSAELHLVSRPEALREIPRDTLRACQSVHFLAAQANGENNEEETSVDGDEVLDGLHAKLFVIDRGWNASVFSGSFNATRSAMRHNVEFMVEMVGKRSRFGVERFLRQGEGETRFADLLRAYDPEIESLPPDPALHQLDELIRAVRSSIARGRPKLTVAATGDPDRFDVRLHWKRPSRWPKAGVEVRVWPISQPRERSLPLAGQVDFPRLSYQGLTPLFAFSIKAEVAGANGESVFVMNLPIEGMPEDREDRVLASLLAGQEMRYLLFLLSSGDETSAGSLDLARMLSGPENAEGRGHAPVGLFETLLRTLHRNPAQLDRVASLLESLRRGSKGNEESALLDPDFQKIWGPIWEVARKGKQE